MFSNRMFSVTAIILGAAATMAGQPNPPKWYGALERPEWWIVIVAALTLITIAWQAVEMRRATDAMKATTKLQELGLRQWVSFENWQVEAMGSSEEQELRIKFRVVNPTTMPLRLNEVRVGVSGSEVLVSDHGHYLVPKDSYLVVFTTHLRKQRRLSTRVRA